MVSAKWSFCMVLFPIALGTFRYYGMYLSYGTGDTIIGTFHGHGGTTVPNRKWIAECSDGEAMVGLSDTENDFTTIQQIWCKHTFPNKPPATGLYPYYPSCHVRNYTINFFCFDPHRPNVTLNTLITGLWSNNLYWLLDVAGTDGLYKCCAPPAGYYVDYLSCYYAPTHDLFFEYYDSRSTFLLICAQGFVMTGLSKKINPHSLLYHLEWIQCCRIGFGPHKFTMPPVIYNEKSGAAAFYSPRSDDAYNPAKNNAHLSNYRTTRAAYGDDEVDEYFVDKLLALNETGLSSAEKEEIAAKKSRIMKNRAGQPFISEFGPLRKSLKIERDGPDFSQL